MKWVGVLCLETFTGGTMGWCATDSRVGPDDLSRGKCGNDLDSTRPRPTGRESGNAHCAVCFKGVGVNVMGVRPQFTSAEPSLSCILCLAIKTSNRYGLASGWSD